MSVKRFCVRDVLTVATGVTVYSGDDLSGVYALASFLSGRRIRTLWLVFTDKNKEVLSSQYPQLGNDEMILALLELKQRLVGVADEDEKRREEIVSIWVSEQKIRCGFDSNTLEVESPRHTKP
jgi:hypothetical protein